MNLRYSVSSYLRAAGDWARGTTKPDYGVSEPVYKGPLPVVPNRFRVLELLGQGGMGIVYRAFDTELEREVALKSLRHLESSDVYHLKNEFRSRADLEHPHLVELYELYADRRGCFFTMELLRGTDLVKHVRGPDLRPDYERLRDCARQLASAIAVVHAAGMLHRDIKPSNVMVTPGGRAVLLDFGLAAQLSQRGFVEHGQRNAAGTVEYMAPEQGEGFALSAASDWYAFGVTLYEAITGLLPYDGSTLEELRVARSRTLKIRLSEFDPNIPADLEELIQALILPKKEERPAGAEILRRLGGIGSDSIPPARLSERPARVFTNRSSELFQLQAAFTETRAGTTRVMAITGLSGIGKSELARHFTELCRAHGAVTLQARCHPRESVAFNAIDGLVDDLGRLLSDPSAADLSLLPAERAASLLRLFPTLGRVQAFRNAASSLGSGGQLYALAFSGLRQILSKVAERAPLVIWIDDAQSADTDSAKLLRDLLEPPDPPRVLLLLTYRVGREREGSALSAASNGLDGVPAAWCSRLELGPLSATHSRELAETLLDHGGEQAHVAIDWLIDQATGSPFFIRELAHHLNRRGQQGLQVASDIDLSGVLQQRLNDLDRDMRAILEVAAVAGGRVEQRVLLRAAALDISTLPRIQSLERAFLLRAHRDAHGTHAEVYHQLISDQILSTMSIERRRDQHRALGDAMLAADHSNLTRVVEQYENAGALDRVRCYIVSAAARAASTFAFALASQLYARAIDLGGTELSDQELFRRLGDSYADQGRCVEAARAYERAIEQAELHGLADQAIVCCRLAASQYLQAGDEGAGLRLLERTLIAHQLPVPTTRASAVRRLLWYRLLLLVRGLSFTQRSESELASGQLNRLDALWITSRTWSLVEHTTSMAFGAQLLVEALDTGEPRRLMQALATEAVALSAGPSRFLWSYVDRMHAIIDVLASESNDRYMQAGRSACRGIVFWFRGELEQAITQLDNGLAIYRTMPRTAALDISLCQNFRFALLAHLGQVKRLRGELEDAIRDAQLRKDRYLLRAVTAGQSVLGFLANDELDSARTWADAVTALPTPEFSTADYWHLLSHTQIELYQGHGAKAFARMERAWPALKKNHFLTLSFVADELHYLRARAALAFAAEQLAQGGRLSRPVSAALKLAEQQVTIIERHGLGPSQAWTPLVRAGVFMLKGDIAASKRALRMAIFGFEAQKMPLYRAVAQHALGTISDVKERARLCGEAEAAAKQEEIKNWASFIRVFFPPLAS